MEVRESKVSAPLVDEYKKVFDEGDILVLHDGVLYVIGHGLMFNVEIHETMASRIKNFFMRIFHKAN